MKDNFRALDSLTNTTAIGDKKNSKPNSVVAIEER